MMGHWNIRNSHYYGHESKTKYPPRIVEKMGDKPWTAVYDTPNYYDAKKAGHFATVEEAIAYAVSGGEPLDLTNTER